VAGGGGGVKLGVWGMGWWPMFPVCFT
jgi:hypothetical protein